MIALSTSDISLSFGAEEILKNISFSVNDGDRVGVIGVNGAGKTSLFRIITGNYTPDNGAVYIQKGHSVGILEQNPDLSSLPGEITCIEYMYTAYPTLLSLEKEIAKTEIMLSGAAERGDGDEIISLTSRLNEQNNRFASLGGLEFRSRCRGMLLRLVQHKNIRLGGKQSCKRKPGVLTARKSTDFSLYQLVVESKP